MYWPGNRWKDRQAPVKEHLQLKCNWEEKLKKIHKLVGNIFPSKIERKGIASRSFK